MQAIRGSEALAWPLARDMRVTMNPQAKRRQRDPAAPRALYYPPSTPVGSRRVVIALALAAYLALGLRFGRSFSAFGEELMVQPGPAVTMLTARGGSAEVLSAPSCRGAGLRTLWLPDRPRWSLCAGGRQWPIMLSGYLGAFLFWPLGVLGAALGDDLLLRRALSTLVGVFALLLGARVARDSDGDEAELPVLMALAVTPAFVVVHAIFLHYETAPSTLFCLAAALYARDLRRGPLRAQTLWAIALLCGLAVAVNLRYAIVLVALAVTAWRLRAPRPRVGAANVAIALWCMAIALSPVLLRYALDVGGARGDRSSTLMPVLRTNLARPWVIARTIDDVLRWWSNLADYLAQFNGAAGFNHPAMVLAAAAMAWTVLGGLRALWRREGSALHAVLSLTIVGFWVSGALIYAWYPRNMAPLHGAFGLAYGLMLHRLSRSLARRGVSERARLAVCAALCVPFAVNVEQLRAASLRSPAPYNLVSERAMGAYLQAHPLPTGRLVSMDLYLAGVFESLGAGGSEMAYAEPLWQGCAPRDGACLASRARALVAWSGDRPLRVVMLAPDPSLPVADRGMSFSRMRAVLRAGGARVVDEFHARTPAGTDGILLMRLYREGDSRSSASSPGAMRVATTR